MQKELSALSKKYLREGKVVSPLNDRVFKSLLSDPNCRGFLIELIHGITHIPKEYMEENLRIENVEHTINHVNEKRKISDMIVSFRGNMINLEMNQYYYEGIVEKNLSYAMKIQSDHILIGSSYAELNKTILINFDNYEKYGDELIIKFQLRDEKGRIETKNFESYHINLEKVKRMYYNRVELSKLEKEILLLSEENIKTLEEISKGESYMEEAKDKLVHLTEDSQFIGLYDGEKMKEWENNTRLEYAKKQGRESGLKEGYESGLKEGQIRIAKKLKDMGMDIKDISDATGLSIEDIESL